MSIKSFISKYTTAAIDNEKVAKVEKFYGVELPEEFKHFVSACGDEPFFYSFNGVKLRILSLDEIVDEEGDYASFKSMEVIPLIDCYDGDTAVYDFGEDCWSMYNVDDDDFYAKADDLESFINEAYNMDEIDEASDDDDLQTKVMKAIQELNLPEGSFKMMSVFEAAEAGVPRAMYDAGCRYLDGDGVEQSYEKAFELFEKAAEKGEVEAISKIGVCYLEGLGVEQNVELAVEKFTVAAEQGCDEAQFNLGRCYLLGNGVDVDIEKGVDWVRKAADQNNTYALFFMGLLTKAGDGGVQKNEEEAFRLFSKAAKQDFDEAKLELGRCYENGTGVAQDLKKAAQLYAEAAENGVKDAQDALGNLKDKMKDRNEELRKLVKTEKVIKIADFVDVVNLLREEGTDFLFCPGNFKVLHGYELLKLNLNDDDEDAVLLDEADVYDKFKNELSAEEFSSYNFYLLKGASSAQFAFKK